MVRHLASFISCSLALLALLAGCAGPPMQVRVWPTADATGMIEQGVQPDYPEWAGRTRPAHTIGLAFSGGGTMSATASVGALRGLQHLGVLQRVDYVSCVSGGLWGVLPYVFLNLGEARAHGSRVPELHSQAAQDERYLGTYKPPAQLTLADLNTRPEGSFISLVTNTHFHMPWLDLRGDENFAHMLSSSFLKPLGLGDEERYVCGSAAQLREVLARNPGLSSKDFYVAGPHKPFLIAGMALERSHRTTLLHKLAAAISPQPTAVADGYFPAEATPLYTGMATVSLHCAQDTCFPERPVGGGFIETAGFDATFRRWEQARQIAIVQHPMPGLLGSHRAPAFGLGDMLAASGSAPAAAAGPLVQPLGLRPKFHTFNPSLAKAQQDSPEQGFVDGGMCDNTGVAALLAHRVTNIIAFVNAVPPFGTSFEPHRTPPPPGHRLTTALTSLFGEAGVETPSALFGWRTSILATPMTNHVLDNEDGKKLRAIEAAFEHLAQQGRPLVFCDDYQTVAHDTGGHSGLQRYDIRGGQHVRICWVYLTASSLQHDRHCPAVAAATLADGWLTQLSPEIKDVFSQPREIVRHGLRGFPRFNVIGANAGHLQQLSVLQANALAHYSAHNVVDSADAIRKAFAPP